MRLQRPNCSGEGTETQKSESLVRGPRNSERFNPDSCVNQSQTPMAAFINKGRGVGGVAEGEGTSQTGAGCNTVALTSYFTIIQQARASIIETDTAKAFTNTKGPKYSFAKSEI